MNPQKIRNATDLEILYRRVCLLGEKILLPNLKEAYLATVPFSFSLGTSQQFLIKNENVKKWVLESSLKEEEENIQFWVTLMEGYYREHPNEMKGIYLDILPENVKMHIIQYVNSLPHKTLIFSHGVTSERCFNIIVRLMSLFPQKNTHFHFYPVNAFEEFQIKAKPTKKCFQIAYLTGTPQKATEFITSAAPMVRTHYHITKNYMGWTRIKLGVSAFDLLKIVENISGKCSNFSFGELENLTHWISLLGYSFTLTHENVHNIFSGVICSPFLDLAWTQLSTFVPTKEIC